MNNLHSLKLPTWQIERAKILHRICRRIQSRKTAGNSIRKTVKRISRHWNGKPLKCDPARRLALAPATLYYLYRTWRLCGETPNALFLKYGPGNRRLPARVVIRFVNFCADRDFPSFKAAWLAFCQRGGNAGPGRVNGKALSLGYDALAWNLPKGCFRVFKGCWKAIRDAEKEISRHRLTCIAQIMARIPARVQRPINFEI